MPAGRYSILDDHARTLGTEEFRCAPGPMGWRYFSKIEFDDDDPHSEIVDLVVDSSWRPVRTRIETGSHTILLVAESDRLVGFRDREPVDIPWGPTTGLTYASPAFDVASANGLARSAEIDVVSLEPVTCEPALERRRYEPMDDEEIETAVGRFAATRWQVTAPASGSSATLWISGDVLVRSEGRYELESYESGASGPPTLS